MTGTPGATGAAMGGRPRPIRVLVVDDSAFMRHTIGRLLADAADIEVVGTAADGVAGLEAASALRPDVITLDIEMPRLDGLAMLRRLMLECPTRTVMLSSLTRAGAQATLDALEAGAVDFVAKPSGSLSVDIGRVGEELLAKIRAAAAVPDLVFAALRLRAAARLRTSERVADAGPRGPERDNGFAARAGSRATTGRPRVPADRLVVVAASTGGPAALDTLVRGLPEHLGAAILIVQHMPAGFTASLAERLGAAGSLPCREAARGDILGVDEILVTPGGHHLLATPAGRLELADLPPVHGVRPSADVTLASLAPTWGERLLAVVLTGMGRDACDGARAVVDHGGRVIAQDEATSTVYGMPSAVVEAGLAEAVLPLPDIAGAIAAWARRAPDDRTSRGAPRSGRTPMATTPLRG
jgi:two-component system chemotaxis response regulator CheB